MTLEVEAQPARNMEQAPNEPTSCSEEYEHDTVGNFIHSFAFLFDRGGVK